MLVITALGIATVAYLGYRRYMVQQSFKNWASYASKPANGFKEQPKLAQIVRR